jgi:hypothetical protein
MTETLTRKASLVDLLGSALRDGGHALTAVPGLLKQVLVDDGWRDFVTQRGERAQHDRIEDFVRTPPLKGLGASVELVERVIGTDDPDLLRMWRAAQKVGRGHRRQGDSPSLSDDETGKAADRLARDAPEEYEAVRRGEKTINAAARAAGIRPHRISVRLDRPDSIARSLRRYMPPDQLATLARLLLEG